MQIACPNCGATYDVADDAIGPAGRKVRCRACQTSWTATRPAPPPVVAEAGLPPPVDPAPAPETPAIDAFAPVPAFAARRPFLRGPVLLGLLVAIVLLLGIVVAIVAWGPRQVAGALGITDKPVPLGIAITNQPDWRMIAGGSELFAVSGKIWNPTNAAQPVPDIQAELKDQRGKTVYSWTIAHPVAQLAPGQSVDFDGAAVDVPRTSQRIAVSFAKTTGR